jgi:hypothetical protein
MHLTLFVSITLLNLVGVLNITILAGHPEMLSYTCLLELLICLI